MIYYKLYQGKNTRTDTKGKWYARAAYTGTVSLDELSEHMSAHNTPYSAGAIKGVLTDMVSCIKELLLEGKQVKLPDLAIFGVGLSTRGAESRQEFTVAKNIKSVHLKTRGTGRLKNSAVEDAIVLREYGSYAGATTTGGSSGAQTTSDTGGSQAVGD